MRRFEMGSARRLSVIEERFALARSFRIARGVKSHADVLVVSIADGDRVGRGEGVPYARYGETMPDAIASILELSDAIAAGMDREALCQQLAPGAARNALDCALWDLQCKLSGRAVWQLAGLPRPTAVTTAYTLSLADDAEAVARAHAQRPVLKIKLDGDRDAARVAAVRRGAPRSRIIVDANEAWSPDDVLERSRELAALGVALIEQPLPAGDDAVLAEIPHPVAIAADESCHDRASLAEVIERYDVVNIKLDKAGGLSEALAMHRRARELGAKVMVGCMCSTSLSIAPALLVAQGAAFVDLDAGLLLQSDRPRGAVYRGSEVDPLPALWGLPA